MQVLFRKCCVQCSAEAFHVRVGGPSYSGKTTIVRRMALTNEEISPDNNIVTHTQGLEISLVKRERMVLFLYDSEDMDEDDAATAQYVNTQPGSVTLGQPEGLIFVVDGSDKGRFPLAAKMLQDFVECFYRTNILLIVITKSDVVEEMPGRSPHPLSDLVQEFLSLISQPTLMHRTWLISLVRRRQGSGEKGDHHYSVKYDVPYLLGIDDDYNHLTSKPLCLSRADEVISFASLTDDIIYCLNNDNKSDYSIEILKLCCLRLFPDNTIGSNPQFCRKLLAKSLPFILPRYKHLDSLQNRSLPWIDKSQCVSWTTHFTNRTLIVLDSCCAKIILTPGSSLSRVAVPQTAYVSLTVSNWKSADLESWLKSDHSARASCITFEKLEMSFSLCRPTRRLSVNKTLAACCVRAFNSGGPFANSLLASEWRLESEEDMMIISGFVETMQLHETSIFVHYVESLNTFHIWEMTLDSINVQINNFIDPFVDSDGRNNFLRCTPPSSVKKPPLYVIRWENIDSPSTQSSPKLSPLSCNIRTSQSPRTISRSSAADKSPHLSPLTWTSEIAPYSMPRRQSKSLDLISKDSVITVRGRCTSGWPVDPFGLPTELSLEKVKFENLPEFVKWGVSHSRPEGLKSTLWVYDPIPPPPLAKKFDELPEETNKPYFMIWDFQYWVAESTVPKLNPDILNKQVYPNALRVISVEFECICNIIANLLESGAFTPPTCEGDFNFNWFAKKTLTHLHIGPNLILTQNDMNKTRWAISTRDLSRQQAVQVTPKSIIYSQVQIFGLPISIYSKVETRVRSNMGTNDNCCLRPSLPTHFRISNQFYILNGMDVYGQIDRLDLIRQANLEEISIPSDLDPVPVEFHNPDMKSLLDAVLAVVVPTVVDSKLIEIVRRFVPGPFSLGTTGRLGIEVFIHDKPAILVTEDGSSNLMPPSLTGDSANFQSAEFLEAIAQNICKRLDLEAGEITLSKRAILSKCVFDEYILIVPFTYPGTPGSKATSSVLVHFIHEQFKSAVIGHMNVFIRARSKKNVECGALIYRTTTPFSSQKPALVDRVKSSWPVFRKFGPLWIHQANSLNIGDASSASQLIDRWDPELSSTPSMLLLATLILLSSPYSKAPNGNFWAPLTLEIGDALFWESDHLKKSSLKNNITQLIYISLFHGTRWHRTQLISALAHRDMDIIHTLTKTAIQTAALSLFSTAGLFESLAQLKTLIKCLNQNILTIVQAVNMIDLYGYSPKRKSYYEDDFPSFSYITELYKIETNTAHSLSGIPMKLPDFLSHFNGTVKILRDLAVRKQARHHLKKLTLWIWDTGRQLAESDPKTVKNLSRDALNQMGKLTSHLIWYKQLAADESRLIPLTYTLAWSLINLLSGNASSMVQSLESAMVAIIERVCGQDFQHLDLTNDAFAYRNEIILGHLCSTVLTYTAYFFDEVDLSTLYGTISRFFRNWYDLIDGSEILLATGPPLLAPKGYSVFSRLLMDERIAEKRPNSMTAVEEIGPNFEFISGCEVPRSILHDLKGGIDCDDSSALDICGILLHNIWRTTFSLHTLIRQSLADTADIYHHNDETKNQRDRVRDFFQALTKRCPVWVSGNNGHSAVLGLGRPRCLRHDESLTKCDEELSLENENLIKNGDDVWILQNPAPNLSFLDLDPGIRHISTATFHAILTDHTGQLVVWGSTKFGQLGLTLNEYKSALSASLIQRFIRYYFYDYQEGINQKITDSFYEANHQLPWSIIRPMKLVLFGDSSLKFVKSAVGTDFSVVLTEDGDLISFGNPQSGCLGRQTTSSAPGYLTSIREKIVDICGGVQHCVGLTRCGNLVLWGSNMSKLPQTIYIYKSPGPRTSIVENFKNKKLSVWCSEIHNDSCFLASNEGPLNEVCSHGLLKDCSLSSVLSRIIFKSIVSGEAHSLGIGYFEDDPTCRTKLWTWGSNEFCQLGHPNINTNDAIIQNFDYLDLPDHNIRYINAAGASSVCVTDLNELLVWGCNDYDALGVSNLPSISQPTLVRNDVTQALLSPTTPTMACQTKDGSILIIGRPETAPSSWKSDLASVPRLQKIFQFSTSKNWTELHRLSSQTCRHTNHTPPPSRIRLPFPARIFSLGANFSVYCLNTANEDNMMLPNSVFSPLTSRSTALSEINDDDSPKNQDPVPLDQLIRDGPPLPVALSNVWPLAHKVTPPPIPTASKASQIFSQIGNAGIEHLTKLSELVVSGVVERGIGGVDEWITGQVISRNSQYTSPWNSPLPTEDQIPTAHSSPTQYNSHISPQTSRNPRFSIQPPTVSFTRAPQFVRSRGTFWVPPAPVSRPLSRPPVVLHRPPNALYSQINAPTKPATITRPVVWRTNIPLQAPNSSLSRSFFRPPPS